MNFKILVLSLMCASLFSLGYAEESNECCQHEKKCETKKRDCCCEGERPWYEDEKNTDATWPGKRQDPFYDELTR
jgi:hypothetical protein